MAMTIFTHLLTFGFMKMERQIIKEGTIKMSEKMRSRFGVRGPIGVVRSPKLSIEEGVCWSKKSAYTYRNKRLVQSAASLILVSILESTSDLLSIIRFGFEKLPLLDGESYVLVA